MIHVNLWSQEIDSGVSVSYKGCRNAPRYCHEVEFAFGTGNAMSFWATDLQKIKDTLELALKTVSNAMEAAQCSIVKP